MVGVFNWDDQEKRPSRRESVLGNVRIHSRNQNIESRLSRERLHDLPNPCANNLILVHLNEILAMTMVGL